MQIVAPEYWEEFSERKESSSDSNGLFRGKGGKRFAGMGLFLTSDVPTSIDFVFV
jgi:hypothetical protein